MYVGIDHGTTSIRFASTGTQFKISREDAREFRWQDLSRIGAIEEIEGIGLSHSMGDGISSVTPISSVSNRGLVSREGAGKHIGGGTRVFDEIQKSGIPAWVIPGLHRGSPTDRRFKIYSHQASPEKVGIAYEVSHTLGENFVVSDVSSNTVTLLVKDGRITGAFDACIFAPGLEHGALDVAAIRRIDSGQSTANEAFIHAGVNYTLPPEERQRTVALFAAMECAGMLILNPGARVALAGSLAPLIADEVEALLCSPVAVYDEWCASRGIARIACDVASGARKILGINVDM